MAKQSVEEKTQMAPEAPTTMTVLNKGKRAHHVNPADVHQGGTLAPDGKYHEIRQGNVVTVSEKLGKQLLNRYPEEFTDVTPKKG